MTGLPTILVKLDDGTGTFPHDITAYVHMPTGIGVDHGRQDEFATVEAARLSLRLDNVDGRFTIGAPTYGIHVDQRIRFTETVGATVSKRFTGYVQDWPLSWPSPTATMATVTVSAFDRFTRLARRKLRSLVENEILLDNPVAYYTLGEPEGSASAGGTSGNGEPPLVQVGAGTAVVFGTATTDELTSATFAGGKYLRAPIVFKSIDNCAGFFFLIASAPPGDRTVFTAGLLSLVVNASGQVSLGSITSAGSLADNTRHHAFLVRSGGTGWLYIDGVLVGSAAQPGWPAVATTVTGDVTVGGAAPTNVPAACVVAHAAVWDAAVAAGRIAAHAEAGLSGFAAQTADARIRNLASYVGLTAGDLDLEASTTTIPTQATAGTSPLDAMRRVETAEGGVLFVAGDGRLTFHGRTHRALAATGTPALTVAAADVDHDDLVISTDKQYLQNTVTGTRTGGATQTVVSATSVAIYDEYPADLTDLLVATDDEVLARINWQVAAYDDVAPRLSSVTIDLLTVSQAIRQAVLALEIGDRLTVSGLPTQSPIATADLIIEGWSERVSSGVWSITFNTAPAEMFHAWVLGDPVYGVLGSTTRIHF